MSVQLNPSKLKPNNGLVVVKLPDSVNKIRTQSGFELYIDTSWDEEKFEPVYGDIVALPDALLQDENERWLPLNLKVGDRVFFHYLTVPNARDWHNSGGYFEFEGGRYAIIQYESLFFSLWNLTIEGQPDPKVQYQMLNNYVLVEPVFKNQHVEFIPGYGNIVVDDEQKSSIIMLADKRHDHNTTEGIVTSADASTGLQAGDHIIFVVDSDVQVEYEATQILDKKYFRMLTKDVLCKIEDDEAVPIGSAVIIEPEPIVKKASHIILLQEIRTKEALLGKVVKIGSSVKWVKPGDRIAYEKSPLKRDIIIDMVRHDLLDEEFIHCKIEGGKITL